MKELVDRIRQEGVNLGTEILKIDSLLNHQIDPQLMMNMGKEFASVLPKADRILTAEVSGIGPALMTGLAMKVPVVFARKKQPVTMKTPVYKETSTSRTKGGSVDLIVSSEYLHRGEKVLIIDDFLASGETMKAMIRLVESAEATVVGCGVVVEKSFQGGRAALATDYPSLPIHSLALITSMEGNKIELA